MAADSDQGRWGPGWCRGALTETLPGLLVRLTITSVALIGASAVVSAIDVSGLGGRVIRFGYQQFDAGIMAWVVIMPIAPCRWCHMRANGYSHIPSSLADAWHWDRPAPLLSL